MKHTIWLLLMLMTIACFSACRALGHPSIEDLLIDLSAFPKGWSEDMDGPDPIDRAPLGGTKSVESIEIFFYVYGSGAYESIQRLRELNGSGRRICSAVEACVSRNRIYHSVGYTG